MKRTLAIFLAVLMMFSMFGVLASAQEVQPPVTVVFKDYDGAVLGEIHLYPGDNIHQYIEFKTPVREDTETTRYTFKGWTDDNGKLWKGTATIPNPTDADLGKTIIYTATYSEEDISERQTFWNLIESIFERINMIFEYFSKIFNW